MEINLGTMDSGETILVFHSLFIHVAKVFHGYQVLYITFTQQMIKMSCVLTLELALNELPWICKRFSQPELDIEP